MVHRIVELFLSVPAAVAIFVVFLLAAGETALFLGLVIPGELVVILGGALASRSRVPLAGILAAGILGPITGDSIGYFLGRRYGRRFLRRRRMEKWARARQWLRKRGAMPPEEFVPVFECVAEAVNCAHERGIVHRDLKPSNVMLTEHGGRRIAKLLDFGIAKAAMRSVETQSGIIKGKFAYMAPEQCRGRDVDRRSDVFSLGIILYEISTQHRCFRADSDFDTMHRIVTGDVVNDLTPMVGDPNVSIHVGKCFTCNVERA